MLAVGRYVVFLVGFAEALTWAAPVNPSWAPDESAPAANGTKQRAATHSATQPATQPAPSTKGQAQSQPAAVTTSPPISGPNVPIAGRRSLHPDSPGVDTTGTPPLPARNGALPPPSATSSGGKRNLPVYDGRPKEALTAGDVLIWIPRGLFYPLHLVLEYGLRWPLVKGITLAEENHLIERIKWLFTFREGKTMIIPTAFVEFGLRPNVGFLFSWNDLFVPKNNIVIQAGFWDENWVDVQVTDSFPIFASDAGTITLRGEFLTRPDRPYYGVGSKIAAADETFYRVRRVEADLGLRAGLGDLHRIEFKLGYRNVAFGEGQQPVVETAFTHADMPGFESGYDLLRADLKIEIDSRSPVRSYNPGSGARLELFGSFNIDPTTTQRHFFTWGAEGALFWDFSGVNHVIAFRVYAEFVEQSGDVEVPFSELIVLGGDRMRGFLDGRLRGASAFVTTLDYRYPISAIFDASLFMSLGNVFERHLGGFGIGNMHLSWGLGLRAYLSRDASFDILVAFGSNRLGCLGQVGQDRTCSSESFALENTRFLIGVNQGF